MDTKKQAIQIKKKENNLLRPFCLTKGFKTALKMALIHCGINRLEEDFRANVFTLTDEIIDNIASSLRNEPLK